MSSQADVLEGVDFAREGVDFVLEGVDFLALRGKFFGILIPSQLKQFRQSNFRTKQQR